MGRSFTDKINEEFNNILIVDSLNLCFRYLHSNSRHFAVDMFSTIGSFANSYKAKKIYVLGDWGSQYRRSIYPKYKEDRRIKRESQTEEDEVKFTEFLDEYHKGLKLCEDIYNVIRLEGVEADDIAAYIVKYTPEDTYDHIWLISTDSDWDLLVGENVSRFAYTTRKEFTVETFEELKGYPLADHLSVKVLQGDKSDSIPGVEQVGAKRASGLIRKYGSALDIYDALPLEGAQKFIQNLNNFGDTILLNYELMDLLSYCDDALGDHTTTVDKEIYK